MEKPCEFCRALSPVVLCKSDAAHLCLSCDAKVHSANALSSRHPRTLICQLCRHQPAIFQCLDHVMFMCQSCCDSSHDVSLEEHQKRVIGCYTGCPSAMDLAELWGIEINKDHSCTAAAAAASNDSKITRVKREVASLSDGMILKCGVPFSSRGKKVVKGDNRQQNSILILQQILDLERLQLRGEGIVGGSCSSQVKELRRKCLPERRKLNPHTEYFDGVVDFEEKTLSSPFLQLENSFWQCRSPLQNNEVWLQNMQDLGVCDDVQCFEDVNIPDVDRTFKNFEDIFVEESSTNTDSTFDGDHPCFGKLAKLCGSRIQDKETGKADHLQHPPKARPSYLESSFSVSRNTGESTSSEFKDDGISPNYTEKMIQHGTTMNSKPEGKEKAIMRYKEKKVLRHERQARYASPWSKSELRKHEKVRF